MEAITVFFVNFWQGFIRAIEQDTIMVYMLCTYVGMVLLERVLYVYSAYKWNERSALSNIAISSINLSWGG